MLSYGISSHDTTVLAVGSVSLLPRPLFLLIELVCSSMDSMIIIDVDTPAFCILYS